MSDRTAFLLESEAKGDESISTPDGWLVEEEPGRTILARSTVTLQEYFASGPGEQLDASHYDWNWDDPSASGLSWVPVGDPLRDSIFQGENTGHSAEVTGDNAWGLVPDRLPHMEFAPTSPGEVVRASLPDLKAFPAAPVTIPAGSDVHILLDRKTLTTAYPELTVSGGKGAQIQLTYSEALYDKEGHKGDRNDVGDRIARGLCDRFLPDGGSHRTFEPLWWRTWRYLDLDIQTADQPLQLDSLTASFTAYPFVERATFQSPDPDLAKIWEISWRTARLDAHETYMDTPYYEQLQYVGDTRIQALISYAVANDDRLALQALHAFDESRVPDGITHSRYPSSLSQFIPTFSLLYIGMVHDYWMYRPDPAPARALLPGTRTVLDWFARYEQPDGLLHELPWWSFIDWVSSGKIPTYSASGESCATTLEYLGALGEAADLEKALGDPVLATRYQARAAHVRAGLYSKCWNASRGLIADNPDQKDFSQQSNILAVLYDVIPKESQKQVLHHMLHLNPGDIPPTACSALPTTSASISPARSSTPAWPTTISAPSTPGASSCRSTSAPGPRFPATPAPTPTPGPRTPSTTCSPWSPASSRPAPASAPSASRLTSARCPRSPPPIRTPTATSRSITAPKAPASTPPLPCPPNSPAPSSSAASQRRSTRA